MDRVSVTAEQIASLFCIRDATHSSAVEGPLLFAPSACFREENERAADKEDPVRWVAKNAPEAKPA